MKYPKWRRRVKAITEHPDYPSLFKTVEQLRAEGWRAEDFITPPIGMPPPWEEDEDE